MDKRKKFYVKKGVCKICNKKKNLSRNGICVKCATNLVVSANFQMKTKAGPIYEKYLNNLKKSLEKL